MAPTREKERKMAPEFKPDYTDKLPGSMCWDITPSGTKLWCHMPDKRWKLAISLDETISPDKGRALALAFQADRDKEEPSK